MPEPARVFLGWDGPVLPRVARWLLEAHRDDLAGALVVVPGRRSGRLLLTHLLAAAGLPAIAPPRVVTRSGLIDHLLAGGAPVAGPRERLLAWCAALEHAPQGSLPGAGPRGEFSARLAFARELVSAQDDLAEEGLRLADVPARGGGALAAGADAARWHGLAELEREVASRLEAGGLRDPGSARRAALEAAPAGGGRREDGEPVVLCCLAALSGVERSLLERSGAPVTALVAAPVREAALFDAWGAVAVAAWRRRRVSLAGGSLVVADRPRGQAAAVARRVARALAADPDREAGGKRGGVTVGLADSGLADLVAEALAERGIARHDAVGRRLVDTPPWRLLAAAGRYAERRDVPALAELLRQPDLERHLQPALAAAAAKAPPPASRDLGEALEAGDWLSVLDVYTAETALREVRGPLPGDPAGAVLVAAAARAVEAELGAAGERRPLGEWIGRLGSFLVGVYADCPLRDDVAVDRALGRALERLGEELAAQARATLSCGGGPRVRLGEAVELLLAQVAGEHVAADEGSGAVEVVGWLELALDDAPRLVVAGLDEDAVTGAGAAGLLGPALRRSLGLADADTLYARDLYFLELLVASREVTLCTGRRGEQGEPLVPRRILLARPTAELIETVLAIWGEHAQEPEDDDLGPSAEEHGPAGPAFRPILPSPAVRLPTRLPATAFRDYLACPYRFYLRHVLGLRAVRELPRELDPGEFGRLLHAVLGRFAHDPAAASRDAPVIARALEALLADEVGRRAGAEPRVAVRIQLEQLRRRLRSFARWQAEQTAAGWVLVPEHAELRVECALQVDGEPFVVTGRVDRIDRHPERGLRLVDYKSAEQPATPEQAHRRGRGAARRWVDLQLPLYERMLRQRGMTGELELAFVNLGHRLDGDVLAPAQWTPADLADALAAAADVVRGIRARRFWPPGEPPSFDDGFGGIAGDAFPDRARWLEGASR